MNKLFSLLAICGTLLAQQPVVPGGNSYLHIVPSTQPYIVKSSAGVLVSMIVNTAGSGCSANVTDNAGAGTSTQIAVIDCSTYQRAIDYGIAFQNGLTVVVNGTGGDLTVVYR